MSQLAHRRTRSRTPADDRPGSRMVLDLRSSRWIRSITGSCSRSSNIPEDGIPEPGTEPKLSELPKLPRARGDRGGRCRQMDDDELSRSTGRGLRWLDRTAVGRFGGRPCAFLALRLLRVPPTFRHARHPVPTRGPPPPPVPVGAGWRRRARRRSSTRRASSPRASASTSCSTTARFVELDRFVTHRSHRLRHRARRARRRRRRHRARADRRAPRLRLLAGLHRLRRLALRDARRRRSAR